MSSITNVARLMAECVGGGGGGGGGGYNKPLGTAWITFPYIRKRRYGLCGATYLFLVVDTSMRKVRRLIRRRSGRGSRVN